MSLPESELDDQIRDHYERQTLPVKRLADLRARMEEERSIVERRRKWLNGHRLFAMAAALVLLVGFSLSLNHRIQSARLYEAVVLEIVKNYRKDLPIEVETSDYATINTHLSRLDFTVIEPELVRGRGFQLIGGRYCSLQGHLAAQLSLKSEDSAIATLYEVPAVEVIPIGPGYRMTEVKGVRVTLWEEAGILLGLAEQAQ